MVRAAIACYGKIDFVRVDGIMDSEFYVYVLRNSLLNIVEALYKDNWTIQQDNTSVNTFNVTIKVFDSYIIDVIDWPAKNPDLNFF